MNTKTFRIGITDDKLVEGTEAFGAQLFLPDHHNSKCLKLGDTSVTTVFIHDGTYVLGMYKTIYIYMFHHWRRKLLKIRGATLQN